MARTSYRNFLKLLEQWPADPTKSKGRDLGEYLRVRVTEGFKHGDATQVDEAECSRIHASLTRIATNTYAKKYPRTLSSTSTGLSADECRQIVSTEFLKALEAEEEEGYFSRFFKKN